MNSQKGAITAIIVLILGIWLAIPGQAELAEMTVEALKGAIEPSSPGYQVIQNVIFALRIVGVLIVIGDIAYIIQKLRARKCFSRKNRSERDR